MGSISLAETQNSLEEVVGHYSRTGLFTHVFAEAGLFSEEQPRVSLANGVDGARIFDLSSLTKALVTTTLIFDVLDGQNPDSVHVGELLGETWHGLPREILSLGVGSLLGHTSGLPAWRNFWLLPGPGDSHSFFGKSDVAALAQRAQIERVFKRNTLPLMEPIFRYSDLGFILLGVAVEDIRGDLIARVWKRQIESLPNAKSSEDLRYHPRKTASESAIVPTSYCALRQRELRGEVHDENCFALGGATGHSGLFGGGKSVVAYLRDYVQSKLGHSIIEANAKLREEGRDGLAGWRQGSGLTAKYFGNGRSIGHYGFTGCGVWLKLDVDGQPISYSVLLTNRVRSGRVTPAINDFRIKCHTLFENATQA